MILTAGDWDRNFDVESVELDAAIVKMSSYGARKPLTLGQSLRTRYSKVAGN